MNPFKLDGKELTLSKTNMSKIEKEKVDKLIKIMAPSGNPSITTVKNALWMIEHVERPLSCNKGI